MLSKSLRRWPHTETLLDRGFCILIDKGPLFNNQDSYMGFSRHVNNWTDVDPHSDPDNPE